jgi:hypothetical protein
MDMILVGDDSGGTWPAHEVVLTIPESQTQLSIWSIMASPLFMSNNLNTVPEAMREILLNKEMIKVSSWLQVQRL